MLVLFVFCCQSLSAKSSTLNVNTTDAIRNKVTMLFKISAFGTLLDEITYLIKLIRLIDHWIIFYISSPHPWLSFSFFFRLSFLETSKRRRWSSSEVHAVEKTLMAFIVSGKVPRKSECLACIKASPEALKKRSWTGVKFYVKNRITRGIY